jgi:hypothetical protein
MKYSAAFRERADKIDRMVETDFGGAVCIVPPKGEATMDWDISDKDGDVLRFWLKLKTDIDAVIQRLDELARTQQAFRVR